MGQPMKRAMWIGFIVVLLSMAGGLEGKAATIPPDPMPGLYVDLWLPAILK